MTATPIMNFEDENIQKVNIEMKCNEENYDFEEEMIVKFNEKFGNDLSKLNECSEIKCKLEEKKRSIENSLLYNNAEVASKISMAIKHVQSAFDKIKNLSEQHNNLNKSVELYEVKVQKVKSMATDYINKISALEKASDYLEITKEIEELSNSLEIAVNDKNEKKMIANYLMLYDIHSSLTNTKCAYLYTYAKETVHYCCNILKEKFIAEYEEILKLLKWPFIGSVATNTPTTETLNRFQILTGNLIQIQSEKQKSVSKSLCIEYEPLSLPIMQLIKPFKKRFAYHFMSKKQTNKPDKPEWYFTQILTWIRDHQEFIEKYVQPIYTKYLKGTNGKVEFMKGLVLIAMEKLHFELPLLHCDDSLFSHCIDEALGFDKELKNSFGYPSSEPNVIEILTQAQIFVKWINMEKRFALEKMDMLLSSNTAFCPLVSGNIDENRVPECGNSFLTLLGTITERYEMLPQPGHKLQFLMLQLDLIDDFRVRLLQKLREDNVDLLTSNFPYILNTVSYLKDVLNEWGVNTFFLHLQFFKTKIEGKVDPVGTVFDEYIALLEKMKEDLLTELVDSVFMDVKAKSMPYRKDKWHAMESMKNLLKPSITASACQLFQVLITKLHQLQEVLAVPLFKHSWQILANKIDQFLYEEIVSICFFNEGGALQFNYDITKNLFPLFGQYSSKPESNFPLLKDSCGLLSMPQDLGISLKQALLENQENEYNSKEILKDLGIYTLEERNALSILGRRTDLN